MYQAKDFSSLLGLAGFSDTLLNNHFTLYQGYVKNTNTLQEKLSSLLASDQAASPEFAEFKRRFAWEFNGMRLHEYYFGNMSKNGGKVDMAPKIAAKIVQKFASLENWEKEFRATGAMRGIGWVILAYDKEADELFNVWINEHDVGHLAGAVPLLVMDVFEHAFMVDYGLKRADYIAAFWNAIDWNIVEERLQ